jgi:hypothetical protein
MRKRDPPEALSLEERLSLFSGVLPLHPSG